jgi:hypothetical protein
MFGPLVALRGQAANFPQFLAIPVPFVRMAAPTLLPRIRFLVDGGTNEPAPLPTSHFADSVRCRARLPYLRLSGTGRRHDGHLE